MELVLRFSLFTKGEDNEESDGETYSSIFCLGDEEEYHERLDGTPYRKDDVSPPADFLHGDGPCELIQHAGYWNSISNGFQISVDVM